MKVWIDPEKPETIRDALRFSATAARLFRARGMFEMANRSEEVLHQHSVGNWEFDSASYASGTLESIWWELFRCGGVAVFDAVEAELILS